MVILPSTYPSQVTVTVNLFQYCVYNCKAHFTGCNSFEIFHLWIFLKEPNGLERYQLINVFEKPNGLERIHMINGLEEPNCL